MTPDQLREALDKIATSPRITSSLWEWVVVREAARERLAQLEGGLLVDLEIKPPIDLDFPDFTLTLPHAAAAKLKEFLEQLLPLPDRPSK